MAGRRTRSTPRRAKNPPRAVVKRAALVKRAPTTVSGSPPKAASGRAASSLANIRERIDAVDGQLHALINERARLAQQVGISKHAAGHTVDFYRP